MAYVYRHIRLDTNMPFYIGLGSDKFYKRANNKHNRNPIWKRIVAKTEYEIEILFDNITLDFAKEKEKEFISLYGRLNIKTGTLSNISGGGEGMFDVPKYVRKKLSKRFKGDKNPFWGKKHTLESRKKISEMQIGKKRHPMPQSTKDKISKANKGKIPLLKGKKDPKGSLSRSGINHHSYKGKILAFDVNMNLIKEFLCISEAAKFYKTKSTNNIRRVLIGDRNHFKGVIFRYKDDKKIHKLEKIKILDYSTKIVLNTQNGVFCDSINEASKMYNIPHRNLSRYLNNTRKNNTSLIIV